MSCRTLARARLAALAMLLACSACAGAPLVHTDAAAPCTEAHDSVALLASLHGARREGRPPDGELVACLATLPGVGSREALDAALVRFVEGDLAALGEVRHGLAAREGALQLYVQRLEHAGGADAGVLVELALARLRRRDTEAASRALADAAALAPHDLAIVALRVEVDRLARVPRHEVATWLAAQHLPDAPEAWLLRLSVARPAGLARFALHARALASAVAAQRAAPESVLARARVAALLDDSPRAWSHALALLEGARGEAADALAVARGRLLLRLGDRDAALELVRARVRSVPEDDDALALYAELCRELGLDDELVRVEAARRESARAASVRVSDDPALQVALARRLLGGSEAEVAEAISALEHAARLAPEDAGIASLHGHALRLSGDEDGAQQAFTRGAALLSERLKARPERLELAVDLATLRLDGARAPTDALELAEQALAQPGGDALAGLHLARCRALHALDRAVEAETACEQAVASAPAWTRPRERLVELAQERGDTASAAVTLAAILALDPEDGFARGRLASLVAASDPARAARLRVEPLAWPGPNAGELDRALHRLELGGMPRLAVWLRRVSLSAWQGQSPGHWRALADAAASFGGWSLARRAALQAMRLGGSETAVLWLVERQILAGAGAEAAETLAGLVALEPSLGGDGFARLESVARANGLAALGAWAACRARDGQVCGLPPEF